MRVLLGPSVASDRGAAEPGVARMLAGEEGSLVSLREVGVAELARALTQAEVAWLREALVGQEVFRNRSWTRREAGESDEGAVVGYVCGGVLLEEATGDMAADDAPLDEAARKPVVVAVADHVNLTWRSPLTGDNDESVGPRFPSMTRIYAPELVQERLREGHGIIVRPGVVAGVNQDECLDAYEAEAARVDRYLAVSSELTPVAIVAAHMGLRIAAAVVTMGKSPEEEMSSGRT